MKTLIVIAARGGSQGVPQKCARELMGKPVLGYTIEAALKVKKIDCIAVTTEDGKLQEIARRYPVTVVERPSELASDTARIDDALRHCCDKLAKQENYVPELVVLLYGNIPVRAEGIIDRAVEHMIKTGADSVQSLASVGKFHPYWLYRLNGDKAEKYIDNQVYQRQDLPELYMIDGAVGVMKYDSLISAQGNDDPHAFWGRDRRGLVQEAHETVDIDNYRDFYLAESILRQRQAKISAEV